MSPHTAVAGGPPPVTFHAHMVRARERLVRAGLSPEDAALDAEVLLRRVAGWDRAALLLRRHEPAGPAFAAAYGTLVRRRARREPVHLILGAREFWGRDFEVSSQVLVPRPETELIVEAAMAASHTLVAPPRVVDAGTGSGCLAITLALELPAARLTATDISAAAIAVARRNAARHAVADRIGFVRTNFLAGLGAGTDLIVANPPYVRESDRDGLPPEVREHEPGVALFGGRDGLDGLRVLLTQAAARLASGGWLIVEFGLGQDRDLRHLAARHPTLAIAAIPPRSARHPPGRGPAADG